MAEEQKNEIEKIAEKTVKNRKFRNDRSISATPDESRNYLNHNLKLFSLPLIDLQNEEQLNRRIAEYFTICVEDAARPNVTGLAMALGIDRHELYRLASGVKHYPFAPTLKRAYNLIENEMLEYMQNGKINPVAGIFLMKNHHGYTDKTEIEIAPKNPLGDISDQAEIEKRYIEDAEN